MKKPPGVDENTSPRSTGRANPIGETKGKKSFRIKIGRRIFKKKNERIVVIDGSESRNVCGWFEMSAEVRDLETGDVKVRFKFKGGDRHDIVVDVPKAELLPPYVVIQRLANRGFEIRRHKEFKQLLPRLIARMRPKRRIATTGRPGWHEVGDRLTYVTSAWFVSTGDSRRALVELRESTQSAISVKGTFRAWSESVASLCEGSSRPMFAICTALTGPALYLLGESNLGFGFVGPSSTGKSTALAAAASVFGSPKNYSGTFNGTQAGLMAAAYAKNDALLVLDELGEADAQVAETVFYALQNGRGRLRLGPDHELGRRASFRTAILSSGELGITDVMRESARQARQGQTVRAINIPVPERTMFSKMHGRSTKSALVDELNTACTNTHGAVGKRWVKLLAGRRGSATIWLKGHREEILKSLELSAPPNLPSNIVARVASGFALVAAIGEYAILRGILPWPKGSARSAAEKCFKGWARNALDHELPAFEDPLVRVRGFFQSESGRKFAPLANYEDDANRIGLAGFVHNLNSVPVFLVYPVFFAEHICKKLSPAVVLAALKKCNLLVTESRGSALKQIRIPGSKKRVSFYVIRRAILEA